MTMKEQERKAMEEIRKIVDGLGEYSYIGAAMEGVWELMEENISNDFALSVKDRMDAKEKEIADMKARAYKAESDLRCANDNISSLGMKLKSREQEIESLENLANENEESIRDLNEVVNRQNSENSSLALANATLKDEIIHLKAKLYDYITRDGGVK